ncbi:MAG: type II toxin-antitoxin system VapC family toxin [Planctomycetes bacterium]|nr:type II toxin-antitoxin system VapC family toxin [Planctomycetota bacterium]
MTFAALAVGTAVFVDANIFVFHFAPDPILGMPCSQLLQRIEHQEIKGVTSTAVLSEVAHRLMTIEARAVFGWSTGKVALRLKQTPSAIHNLSAFQKAVEQIVSIPSQRAEYSANTSSHCGRYQSTDRPAQQ